MNKIASQRLLAHRMPGIKQFDQTACWAACMSWWGRATRRGGSRTGQMELLNDYSRYWDASITSRSYGTISKSNLQRILNEARWKATTVLLPASRAGNSALVRAVGNGPTIIGFYSAFYRSGHVNVLVAPSMDRRGRQNGFVAMEPYSGTYKHRHYGFYTSSRRSILLAWPK